MNAQDLEIRAINLRSAGEFEYRCLNTFKNILRAEVMPEDPPISNDEYVKRCRTMPNYQQEAASAVWDRKGEKIIAFGEVYAFYTGDNEHLAQFNIEVLPEYRQQGLGRRLLGEVMEFAHRHKRHLLLSGTNDRVPASGAFLSRLGARPGLVAHTNQLRISELDRNLIERWMAQSRRLLDTFDVDIWTNVYPEEQVTSIASLMEELAKDEPRDSLELEDPKYSPEILRQTERNIFATGTKRWTAYILSRADNHLVGLTEVFWNPNRPAILNQGFTGVLPAYRNKGLGHWLKAEMMTQILRECPSVEVIRTGNANSNGPMLKINNALGFKPFIARAFWQVEAELVEKYLAARGLIRGVDIAS